MVQDKKRRRRIERRKGSRKEEGKEYYRTGKEECGLRMTRYLKSLVYKLFKVRQVILRNLGGEGGGGYRKGAVPVDRGILAG